MKYIEGYNGEYHLIKSDDDNPVTNDEVWELLKKWYKDDIGKAFDRYCEYTRNESGEK